MNIYYFRHAIQYNKENLSFVTVLVEYALYLIQCRWNIHKSMIVRQRHEKSTFLLSETREDIQFIRKIWT